MATPLADLVPEEGFLAEYYAFSTKQIMGPPPFHLAASLATLSAAVGRTVYFRLGGRRRYPHLWLLLMAPAGGMKSTVLYPAIDVVRIARGDEAILPSRFSPEAFLDALSASPDGFWNIGEIAAFLKGAGRDYMAGMREDLCDIWDSQSLTRKLRSGTTKVDEPAPTAIATGRMSDFEQASGRSDFLSGFLSRFLVVKSEEAPEYRGLRRNIKKTDHQRAAALARALRDIVDRREESVEVFFKEGAIDTWESQDKEWLDQSANVPALLQGFAKRRGIQALKLAILHAISRTHTPQVDAEDAAWGVEVAEACYQDVATLTLEDIGLERDDIRRQDILDRARELAVQSNGVVPVRDLLRRVGRRVRGMREMDDLINLWAGGGVVEIGRLGRARQLWFPDLAPAPEGWQRQGG